MAQQIPRQPTPRDILFARGQHDRAFLAFVKTRANGAVYLDLNDGEKMYFADYIVAALRADGREFLQLDRATGLWMVAPLIQARDKVQRLLRDAAADERLRRQAEERAFLELCECMELDFNDNDEPLAPPVPIVDDMDSMPPLAPPDVDDMD